MGGIAFLMQDAAKSTPGGIAGRTVKHYRKGIAGRAMGGIDRGLLIAFEKGHRDNGAKRHYRSESGAVPDRGANSPRKRG